MITVRRVGWKIIGRIARLIIPSTRAKLFRYAILASTDPTSPKDSLTFLMHLDNYLYKLESESAVAYSEGIHPKHRLTRYHLFFINNIKAGENVLDIGCGNGALAFDIASHVSDVKIIAIDIALLNIKYAQEHYSHPNITYIHGNALHDLIQEHYNTVVLSNVLEHIDTRVEFLKNITKKIAPEKYLIRVPLFDRDWRVPLKKELGVDYRLDPTHFTEYSLDSFTSEMHEAGLSLIHIEIIWGEIWCVCHSEGM